MEERALAHCKFIFDHAESFQVSREEWKKWRRFDKSSYLYIPKSQKNTMVQQWSSGASPLKIMS
jgi:hypothetical protein